MGAGEGARLKLGEGASEESEAQGTGEQFWGGPRGARPQPHGLLPAFSGGPRTLGDGRGPRSAWSGASTVCAGSLAARACGEGPPAEPRPAPLPRPQTLSPAPPPDSSPRPGPARPPGRSSESWPRPATRLLALPPAPPPPHPQTPPRPPPRPSDSSPRSRPYLSSADPWLWLLVRREKTFRSLRGRVGGDEGGVNPTSVDLAGE